MPAISTYSPTGDPYVDGLLSGVKWAVDTLTFSFPTSSTYYGSPYGNNEPGRGFQALNDAQQDVVRDVLAQYAAVTNLTFTEMTETASDHADLRYAESNKPSTAWAYYPDTDPEGGDAWFNHVDYNDPIKGDYAYTSFLHETGHALGLKHPHDVESPFNAMPVDHDSLEYSVMSYRSYVGQPIEGYVNEEYGFPQSLMMYDIAAVQQLYGANFDTNSGDTTYTWSPTTGEMFIDGEGQGAPGANRIFLTVWDGDGVDTYDFSNYTTAVNVSLEPGEWTTTSASQLALLNEYYVIVDGDDPIYAVGNVANALLYNDDPRSLIENAVGGAGDDTIVGNVAANGLFGGEGSDTLYGEDGNDWLYGGNGGDTLYGGANTDALFGENDNDTLNGGDGDDGLDGGYGNDTLNGDAGVDWLYGSFGNDTLNGGTETDALFGQEDDDVLNGGDGDDSLDGGPGNDTLNGDAGVDWLYGGPGDDQLNGGSETDALFGEGDNDTLHGGSGGDSLDGGDGDDHLFGDGGVDWLFGQAGNDTLDGGSEGDVLFGGADNDTLVGGSGDDSLDGGTGQDSLDGGPGIDVLFGGDDADTFLFSDVSDGGDVIRDFVTGVDEIDINAAGFGLTGTGALDPSQFESGDGLPATFVANDAVFYYETGSNGLWFDPTGGSSDDVVIVAGLETGTVAYTDVFLV